MGRQRLISGMAALGLALTWVATVNAHTGPTADLASVGAFAFDAAVGGHQQLFVEHADGSHLRRLVVSGDDDLWPSISPDGSRVLFTRLFADGSPDAIFTVDADGENLHRLAIPGCGATCLGDDAEGHAWALDGRHIAFERALLDPAGAVSLGLWTADADGSHPHQLTQLGLAVGREDHRPSWSPDSRRLVFQRIDTTVTPEVSALFTLRSDGSDVRQITPWSSNANDPAWSPDGALIAFQAPPDPTPGDYQHIYTIHPDGSGLTRLTSAISVGPGDLQGSNHPSWSPDGRELVFCHFPSTDGGADLFTIRRDGSGLRLVRHTALVENAADWGRASGD